MSKDEKQAQSKANAGLGLSRVEIAERAYDRAQAKADEAKTRLVTARAQVKTREQDGKVKAQSKTDLAISALRKAGFETQAQELELTIANKATADKS